MNSELRLEDGTPVRFIGAIDLKIEYDPLMGPSDFPRYNLREPLNSPSLQASGSLICADIGALMDMMHDNFMEPQEVYYYAPIHRYWELQYLAQGKRYPSPRKRKSQARMSKKWRGRA